MMQTPDNWRWRDQQAEPGEAVIFDMDGVLSDATARQRFLQLEKKDWKGFFDAVGEDVLVEDVAELLHLLDPKLQIILLTGRPMRVQRQTLEWLDRFALKWDLLIMRDMGDYAKAREFKQRTVGELSDFGFKLRLAFEDDQRIAEMFKAEGVPCVYIHSGYYG